MTSASFSAELVAAGLTSEYDMLRLLVSLLGLYMIALGPISWKKSGETPRPSTVEDCVSCTGQMLSLHLSEKHYMFLLASKLRTRASNANQRHFTPGEPQLNSVEP
jgi:hypothetical protein